MLPEVVLYHFALEAALGGTRTLDTPGALGMSDVGAIALVGRREVVVEVVGSLVEVAVVGGVGERSDEVGNRLVSVAMGSFSRFFIF